MDVLTSNNGKYLPGRGLRAALPVLLWIAFLLGSGPVEAGSFRIAPTLGDVPPEKSTETFRITNSGSEMLTVQITAKRWSQADNADVLSNTDDLLIVPPLVTIPPGKTQVVRVASQQRDTRNETAYRLLFHEVPPAPPEGFVGVQTSLRLNIPLFFAPNNGEGKLAWSATGTSSGEVRLQVANRGNRFARFTAIRLQDKTGREVAELGGPQYALVGVTRHWQLESSAPLVRGMQLKAIVEMGSTRQEFPLTLE